MIKVGFMFKLKNGVNLASYYKVDYVIVVSTESNMIDYRDVQNMDSKYTAQICDFLEMFEPWGDNN